MEQQAEQVAIAGYGIVLFIEKCFCDHARRSSLAEYREIF
jgi:hypothetical protein